MQRNTAAGALIVAMVLSLVAAACGGGDGDQARPGPTGSSDELEPANESDTTGRPSTVPTTGPRGAPATRLATADTGPETPPAPKPEWLEEGTARVAYARNANLAVLDEPNGTTRWSLPNPTQFDGPRVVVVLDTWNDWHLVSVPVRPNGTTGWVRAADVRIETHEFRARINLNTRRVVVWNGEDLVADSGAVIGKSSTPTPVGTFFIRDKIRQPSSGGAYGSWILAMSGFSEVLETFDGGLPAIALHGTNRPDLIGGAHSSGCVRIPNDVVEKLADQVPLGTPVEIVS